VRRVIALRWPGGTQEQQMEHTRATIGQLLAQLPSDRAVLIAVDGRSWSGAELRAEVEGHAAAIGAGRAAISCPNGPDAVMSFLGATLAGTAAPVDPGSPPPELDRLFDLLEPDVVVAEPGTPAADVGARLGVRVVAPAARRGGSGWLARPRPDDVALILHTSGTTARPKLVPLTHANLCTSAAAVAATLELGPADRCCNVMPLFHIHGLVAALLASLAAGSSIVATPGFLAPEVAAWIDDTASTWLTAVPTMHQALLERWQDPRARPRVRLRFMRSSSASLPPSVLGGLESVIGCPVIEAYGMTEAAHQMTSNPLPPGQRVAGSVGFAAGPQVAVLAPDGSRAGPGVVGEVVIRGGGVTAGYLGAPEATAAAFTPDGWFRTGDEGRLDTDGRLFLTGRIKELINRGGEKIAPREIDEVLLLHPEVAQAVAFGVADERLGEDVGAVVVLRAGAAATERDLREFASLRLAPHKVPRHVVITAAIPLGPTGKVQRIGLADRLGVVGDVVRSPSGASTPPRTATERFVAGLWAEVLRRGIDELDAAARFVDLGGDSMLATRVLARLRSALDLDITLLDLADRPTIASQAVLIDSLIAQSSP
jgi:acyl-CoA synthetase (AMP-forming)/AMP-acid ligase II/aryl carrier-like protein